MNDDTTRNDRTRNDSGFVSDIAFTPAVKELQERYGSRKNYADPMADWSDRITGDLAAFVAQRNSFYLSTGNRDGQPYIQHRGGPRGFLQVLDAKRLAFADFKGNKQYISTGNLSESPKAFIFLMDYMGRQRVKIWGRAEISEDPELIAQLRVEGYRGRPERAIVFSVEAWDANCPQHIPQKYDEEVVAHALKKLEARILELESELAALKAPS
ncbi:pyridoxamine 5'-phosphate oxidase family protein [Denitrobaculum tricleocarpae]|uniref:Pyridoxamine 5'-phosphate oxidase n=1 Tax=Denitrobaculum tricleocarpae TaxID=2591009 RepID=A0A545TYI6_9PROT|nr:pyridoxamine 5'-phosphate oxidase family protein [Denitrobaculum tricleocarpae]TQV82292.1 pyridoxamine 5'-phosphate oxidase [Denitrobaculum tricleocarpae]